GGAAAGASPAATPAAKPEAPASTEPTAAAATASAGAAVGASGGAGASATPKANPFAAAGGGLPNPFAAPLPGMESGDEDDENVQYGIVASGPPVSPSEVETQDRAVEVVVMWGDRSVLHVEHLSPPRPFFVGEPPADKKAAKEQPVDYLIGSDVLGTSRMPVVVESGGAASVIIPPGATGEVIQGEETTTFEQLGAMGQLQPSSEMPGAQQYTLPAGATAKVRFKGFMFVVKPVNAGKKVTGAPTDIEWRPFFYIGGSMLVHAIFLLMFYFLPPSPASLSLDMLDTDSRLVKYLMEPPETQEEETPEWLQSNKKDDAGGKGKRHKGDEGQMGKKEAKKSNNRYAIEGPEDNEDPHMAREEAKEMAANAGIIGTLKAMSGSWNSPTSPFGKDTALGNDAMSAMGALMGDQAGENFGFGGLGLRGTGRGGGGTGEGTIGLGNLGTIGHGGGGGSGSGYGRGAGGFKGRKASVPKIRSGSADVRGSLSKEVIRRVIRRHINEVRFCYEQQLNQQPDLEGRVTVKFIISPTGAVQSAVVSNTSLGSPPAENCIAQAVRRWTFPAPEGGGIVVVNYPFMLNASG
ncbi:MAG: TonB family protein, partial [Myxococcota bacterium]